MFSRGNMKLVQLVEVQHVSLIFVHGRWTTYHLSSKHVWIYHILQTWGWIFLIQNTKICKATHIFILSQIPHLSISRSIWSTNRFCQQNADLLSHMKDHGLLPPKIGFPIHFRLWNVLSHWRPSKCLAITWLEMALSSSKRRVLQLASNGDWDWMRFISGVEYNFKLWGWTSGLM